MTFTVQIEREADGRWLAEVPDLPGAMTYGQSRDEVAARVQALARWRALANTQGSRPTTSEGIRESAEHRTEDSGT